MEIPVIIPKIGGCFNRRYDAAFVLACWRQAFLLKYMVKQAVPRSAGLFR
jgi:hypothetical protein